MRNSMDSGFNEIKDVKGRRGIRDGSEEILGIPNRLKLNKNEDRSNSEPPRSYGSYFPPTSSRLKPIREKKGREDGQGSSDEDGELSKSNSQLNESDLDLEIPESASASVSQAPTPTPLVASARRINSETNLNDSKRRLSGFMGNRSKRFCASTSELNFTSHLDTHKSLFSPKNNALSRQSFNSSLYGSNMSLSSTNSRLFMVNSPFYSGKTMFGGASAYPKRDINQHKILRTPVQMRPSSSLSNSSNTSTKSDNMVPESNAAKRILEIMNSFSGPLKEARSMGNNISSIIKIPSLVQNRRRYGEDELNLDRSIALSSPSAPYGRPLSGASNKNRPESPLLNSSINKPLQIPTMSQLLQMKRLQNNTERVREIASRSDSFLNRNHEYKLPTTGDDAQNNSNNQSSLKMKSNITKNLLRNDKSTVNDQLPALPVNLPNISLVCQKLPELKSIPKFDIQLPPSSVASGMSPKVSPPKPNSNFATIQPTPAVQFNFQNSLKTSLKATVKESVKPKSDFKLSKPLPVSDGTVDVRSLNHIAEKFILRKPLLISEDDDDAPIEILAKSPVKSSLSTNATDNLFKNLVAQQKTSSWECDSCLTRNDSEKTKCLCCETPKPGSGTAEKVPVTNNKIAPPSDDLFKNLAAQQKKTQWECDACMTKNDAGKDSCACCETPKPGSKPQAAKPLAPAASFSFGMPAASQPAPITGDDLFKKLVADQKKAQWECDACMTRNEANKDKCACCETPKPGSKPANAVAAPSFSFGMKPAESSATKSTFSFGMPPATSASANDVGFKKIVEKQSASWECSACMTRNEPSKTKCVCCEQAKPGTNSTTQFSFGSSLKSSVSLPAVSEVKFSFGMPATKVDAPIETKKDEPTKVDEVDKPKPTFSFGANDNSLSKTESSGLPEVSAAAPVPSFTFKTPAATITSFMKMPEAAEKKEVEKPAEKPTEKPPMFTFGATPAPAKEPEKKITFGNDVKAAEPIKSLGELAKPEEVKKPDFGSFSKFSESAPKQQTPQTTFGSSLNKNGGFSFGGFGGPTNNSVQAADPVKPVAEKAAVAPTAGGFSFGTQSTNSISFGSPATAPPAQSSFVFGGSKAENEPSKTFESFGAAAASDKPSFGMNNAQTAPVFGQSIAASSGFSFGGKKEETAPAASASFSFGAKPAAPSSAPMFFGSNQSSQAQTLTPVFGANSTPTFGTNSTPSFGSNTSNNNNNESGFGSKMPSFGNANQPQKRTFEFTATAPEMPQTKKFDFGGHQQQQQQQQQQSSAFQFGAQGSENKPAFNFIASAAPSFNFSNSTLNNPQDQQNLFQFGAANSNSTQGIFAFAPASAPVMFGSGQAAPSIAIPGINSFTAQSQASTANNQRRILRAARRNTTRR